MPAAAAAANEESPKGRRRLSSDRRKSESWRGASEPVADTVGGAFPIIIGGRDDIVCLAALAGVEGTVASLAPFSMMPSRRSVGVTRLFSRSFRSFPEVGVAAFSVFP
jgi:hypothetical protein